MLSISRSVVTKPRVTKFCARWEYWCNSRTYAITNLYVGRFINRSINIRHVWSADQISMTTDCTRRYRCILSVTCISVHRLPYKELVFFIHSLWYCVLQRHYNVTIPYINAQSLTLQRWLSEKHIWGSVPWSDFCCVLLGQGTLICFSTCKQGVFFLVLIVNVHKNF